MSGMTDTPWADAVAALPWHRPFREWRCRAVREPDGRSPHFGRCELRRRHDGDHALERGFDTPRWSTRWTA